MSTTPPDQPPRQYEQRPATGAGDVGSAGGRDTPFLPAANLDMARLPIPGNAEFLVWLLALIVAAIVAAIADSVDAPAWFQFFLWTTAAYLLSRGIAKASRVLEQ